MSCNVWFRLAWKAHRQTNRSSKKLSLAVAAAGPVLLHGNVLFNITPRDPRPVIGDPVLSVRWQHFL